jgi:hypothetical protein
MAMNMRTGLLTATALIGMSIGGANATLVASFGQNPSPTPTVVATDDGLVTHIGVVSASTSITAGAEGVIPNAFFTLDATSVDPVTVLGSLVIQHYTGTFCFSSAAGCGGTNLLTGVFTDAAFGQSGGPGLTINVNNPPDVLTLTSSVLPASSLGAPSTFNLTFADLTPLLHVDGTTIGAFTADFSGTVSSSVVSEPTHIGLGLLGLGMVGLGMVSGRRRADSTGAMV